MNRTTFVTLLLTCFSMLLSVESLALAAFMPGEELFTNFAGTGVVSHNADDRGGVNGIGFYDHITGGSSTPYRLGSNTLTYTESWTTPQTLGTLMVATPGQEGRSTTGTLLGQFSMGGPFQPLPFSFSASAASIQFYDVNRSNLYGLQLQITPQVSDGVSQIGSLGFYEERFSNVAFGRPRISNPEALNNGNVTDQNMKPDNAATRWMASHSPTPDPAEEFVGVTFDSERTLGGLLVTTASGLSAFLWNDFDVQVFRGGSWVTLGRADYGVSGGTSTSDDLYWINFGQPQLASQVRLYGSTAGGNNPGEVDGSNSELITDILAFDAVIPEPTTACLSWIAVLLGLRLFQRRSI